MSEAHTTSERAGKLNLDGDRRMARRRLGAWVRKLLAADQELAPALRPLPAVEADGPATATTGARAAREAADAADAALCRRLMDVLTLSADGDAEAILFSATTGREAFAALLEAVDADPTTPDGAEALVEDITHLSWNRHAGSMDFAIAAGDILFRLAHAAGVDYAAFALMHYGTGNVRYDDLVRRLVKAVDQDNAPGLFASLHASLSVRLHETNTTLSYKVVIDAVTAHARSVGLARPTGPMGPTMTVTQAEQSSLGIGQREATLMTPRRARRVQTDLVPHLLCPGPRRGRLHRGYTRGRGTVFLLPEDRPLLQEVPVEGRERVRDLGPQRLRRRKCHAHAVPEGQLGGAGALEREEEAGALSRVPAPAAPRRRLDDRDAAEPPRGDELQTL